MFSREMFCVFGFMVLVFGLTLWATQPQAVARQDAEPIHEYFADMTYSTGRNP